MAPPKSSIHSTSQGMGNQALPISRRQAPQTISTSPHLSITGSVRDGQSAPMDPQLRTYIDSLSPDDRALFESMVAKEMNKIKSVSDNRNEQFEDEIINKSPRNNNEIYNFRDSSSNYQIQNTRANPAIDDRQKVRDKQAVYSHQLDEASSRPPIHSERVSLHSQRQSRQQSLADAPVSRSAIIASDSLDTLSALNIGSNNSHHTSGHNSKSSFNASCDEASKKRLAQQTYAKQLANDAATQQVLHNNSTSRSLHTTPRSRNHNTIEANYVSPRKDLFTNFGRGSGGSDNGRSPYAITNDSNSANGFTSSDSIDPRVRKALAQHEYSLALQRDAQVKSNATASSNNRSPYTQIQSSTYERETVVEPSFSGRGRSSDTQREKQRQYALELQRDIEQKQALNAQEGQGIQNMRKSSMTDRKNYARIGAQENDSNHSPHSAFPGQQQLLLQTREQQYTQIARNDALTHFQSTESAERAHESYQIPGLVGNPPNNNSNHSDIEYQYGDASTSHDGYGKLNSYSQSQHDAQNHVGARNRGRSSGGGVSSFTLS